MTTPDADEESRLKALANSLMRKTKKSAERFQESRGVLLGGSFAKGTWLKGHVDLDIFVKLDVSTPEDRFEKVGLDIGRTATRGYQQGKKFAQHPYTEAIVEGVRVNIVPCYAVKKGEWKSAADRSPYHVELIRSLSPSAKSQVRILKAFMNAVGVYGAEIERRGFSGYVAEVLVMKHGSFAAVLRWFSELAVKPGNRPFSLPDPVDDGRDLGIAVSGESLGKMVLASREFLSSPRLESLRRMTSSPHPSLKEGIFAVVFSHRTVSEDTLWGELRKTAKHIVRHLEVNGFPIARSMSASDNKGKSAFLIIPEFTVLPRLEQRVGPTVDRRKDVRAFTSANSRQAKLFWVDDDARVRMLKPREYTRIEVLLSDIVKGRAGETGASPELEAGMKKSAAVLHGPSLSKAAVSSRWLQNGIREISSDAVGTR